MKPRPEKPATSRNRIRLAVWSMYLISMFSCAVMGYRTVFLMMWVPFFLTNMAIMFLVARRRR